MCIRDSRTYRQRDRTVRIFFPGSHLRPGGIGGIAIIKKASCEVLIAFSLRQIFRTAVKGLFIYIKICHDHAVEFLLRHPIFCSVNGQPVGRIPIVYKGVQQLEQIIKIKLPEIFFLPVRQEHIVGAIAYG